MQNSSGFYGSIARLERLKPSPLYIFIVLAVVVVAFYSPVLPTYFLTDDYNYVGHLLVHGRDYVQGEQLAKWFIDFSAQGLQNPELSVFFRPVVQWLWLTDFIAWGTDATGYHLTNIILHVLNSFLVFVIGRLILKNRWAGAGAALLFALHPIHADSVAWIPDRTDVLSTLFYLGSAAFFILYRRDDKQTFGVISVIAFALAIGTKENTVALPLVLAAYDLCFGWRKRGWGILRAQVPYWAVLGGYVALRFITLGEFGRNTGGGFFSYGIGLFAQFYTLSLAQPFITDLDNVQLLLVLSLAAATLLLCRRPEAWFGVAWILFSFAPAASAAYVAPRLAYAPSAGLALAITALLVRPLPQFKAFGRAASAGVFVLLVAAYAWGLTARVDNWSAAGSVASAVVNETRRLHPTVPPDARFYYTGVPDILRNIHIYNDNFAWAIRIAYKDPALQVKRVDSFPLLTEKLDRSFFLEYNRRKITERLDLVQTLGTRRECDSPAVQTWDFEKTNNDWQAWNDLSGLEMRDGTLVLQAVGSDPNLGGPTISIPAGLAGDVEIEMRVRSAAPAPKGSLYWTKTGQDEFSPEQQRTFTVQGDDRFHRYRVPLVGDGNFSMDDNVTRLRLDPIDVPGEIALKSIRVNAACLKRD